MNEIKPNDFDYSTIDSDTASYLKDRENNMSKTLKGAAEKLGEDLYKAQQKLAKKGYGNFEEWYTSLGLKTSSVYRYINRYKFVSSKLEDSKMLEIFQELPSSLKNEMSKPSADPELNQKVYDGDITTHKEYKELENKLKEKNSLLEQAKKSEKIAIEQLEKERSKEPETVKVVPHDYDGLKSDNQQLEFSNRRLRKQMQEMEERQNELLEQQKGMNEKSKKYDELNEAIQEMQGRMDEGQKSIKAQKDVYDLVRKANELIVEVAPLTYLIDVESVLENEYAQKPIKKIINNFREMADRLEKSVSQEILEGEVVNE